MPRPRQLAAGGSARQNLAPNPLPPREWVPPPCHPSHSLFVLERQEGGPRGKQRRGATGLAKASELALLPG